MSPMQRARLIDIQKQLLMRLRIMAVLQFVIVFFIWYTQTMHAYGICGVCCSWFFVNLYMIWSTSNQYDENEDMLDEDWRESTTARNVSRFRQPRNHRQNP